MTIAELIAEWRREADASFNTMTMLDTLRHCAAQLQEAIRLPDFCNWCPDPKRPSSVFHPTGVEHIPRRSYFRDVLEFHRAFGIPIGRRPSLLSEAAQHRRENLEREEQVELQEALERGDLAQQVDAIVDQVYVLLGRAVEMGVDIDAAWAEVHRANMAKVGGGKRADGKHLKPPGWTPPDIAGVLAKQTDLI